MLEVLFQEKRRNSSKNGEVAYAVCSDDAYLRKSKLTHWSKHSDYAYRSKEPYFYRKSQESFGDEGYY